jgi:hypothetical protein
MGLTVGVAGMDVGLSTVSFTSGEIVTISDGTLLLAPMRIVTAILALLLACTSAQAASRGVVSSPTTVQIPGPSVALFTAPYYTCVTNRYVATPAGGGSDSNDGTAPTTRGGHGPWLTLQHADGTKPTAGYCINVGAGTYAAGLNVTHGGNAATTTGYVVYRCATLDGCTITDNVRGLQVDATGTGPSYIMFDGFRLRASSPVTFASGLKLYNKNCGGSNCNNIGSHYWFLNNIVSGYGQAGMTGCCADFVYAVHNTFFNNADAPGCNGGAQGSGISMWQPTASTIADASLTADDKSNNVVGNLAVTQGGLGSTWFRQVYEWNITYNNRMAGCSAGSVTDGNGIIMDAFDGSQGGVGPYQKMTLVAFNVSYNNGGGGVHIFSSGNIIVANNSAYNNYLDTNNSAGWRAGIDCNFCYNSLFINNISQGISMASGVRTNNTSYLNDCEGTAQTGGCVMTGNIAYCTGPSCSSPSYILNPNGGSTATWTSGRDLTNPLWINVGTTSAGSMTSPPVGTNFALQGGAPAIGFLQSKTYLPARTADSGACASSLTTCP